jgi:hypothetical protein
MHFFLSPGVSFFRSGLLQWLAVVAIAGSGSASAQEIALNRAADPLAPAADSSLANAVLPGAGFGGDGAGLGGLSVNALPAIAETPAVSSATSWNRSLFQAFLRTVHFGRASGAGNQAGTLDPFFEKSFGTQSGLGSGVRNLRLPDRLTLPNLDRLAQQAMSLGLISSGIAMQDPYRQAAGRDALELRRNPAAAVTRALAGETPSFIAANRVFNFCSALMGGPAVGRATRGIMIDSVSPGHGRSATSVAIRMTF